MSRGAWKTSRRGRDTFLLRLSSGCTPVAITNVNTKALMGGDVGREGQPVLSAIRSLPILPGRSFRSDFFMGVQP